MQRVSALGPIAVMASCAYYSQEDGERLNNEVYALQTQVTALQQSMTAMQEDHGKKLTSMTEEMAELSKVARRNDADLGVQLEEMLQEVGRMNGQVQTFSERVSDIEAALAKVQGDLDVRYQQLTANQAKDEEEKRRAAELEAKQEKLFANPPAFFKEVESMIAKGEAGEARKMLRAFALRAENDKNMKKHLDAAQFWIGESFLADSKFQQAAAEFNTVRKSHPNSAYVSEAFFKLGVCFENLKLPNDAKLFYNTVVKKYPKSKSADKAKKRLKELK